MDKPKITKDMILFDVFSANPNTMEAVTKLGYQCVDCIVCLKDTIEVAAQLHEKDLGELLTALNAAPEPKPEDTMGWKLVEKLRALEDEHFQAVEKGRAEIEAALTAGVEIRLDSTRHEEQEKLARSVYERFVQLRKAQAAFEKRRAKLLSAEIATVSDEFLEHILLSRPGHPDVVSLLFPGIERRASEAEAWRKMFAPPAAPSAGGASEGAAPVTGDPAPPGDAGPGGA